MAKNTNLPDTEKAEQIESQFLLAKKYLDPIHLRMNQQEEMYRSFIDPNQYPHNARVFDPRVFRVIETITPRMVVNEPSGSFYPAEKGDEKTTQILNTLMRYDWRRAEMFPKQVMFIKSLLIFGTAFGRTYYDYRTKEKTRMVAVKKNGRLMWTPKNNEKIEVTEFDGPNFETLNIYDCFPDPNSTSLHNMRWFIYRTFKTIDELKDENDSKGEEYWKHLDELEKAIKFKKENKNKAGGRKQDITYREHRRVMLGTEDLVGQDESNPEITILIRYTKDRWIFYAPEYAGLGDFSGIIRDVENPYFHGELPIVYGVDYPYPGELYGMGEIEPIDRIQRAINAVLNQRLDNVQLTLRTMWKVQKSKGVDMHTLISAPGNVVTTNDMNAVEPINVPDVTSGTFVQTMNYLTSALQNGSGITDYTQGIQKDNSTVNNTATGIRLIQNEANAQFKLKIQLYNHMVIEKIANIWKDLRIQYTTESQKLRITGNEVKNLRDNTKLSQTTMDGESIMPGDFEAKSKLEITDENFAFLNLLPEDIQPSIVGDYDFVPIISSEQLNDPVIMQENLNRTIAAMTNPIWVEGLAKQGKMLNFEFLSKQSVQKLNSGINPEDVLIDMPQQNVDANGQPVYINNNPQMPSEEDIANVLGNAQDKFRNEVTSATDYLNGPGELYAGR